MPSPCRRAPRCAAPAPWRSRRRSPCAPWRSGARSSDRRGAGRRSGARVGARLRAGRGPQARRLGSGARLPARARRGIRPRERRGGRQDHRRPAVRDRHGHLGGEPRAARGDPPRERAPRRPARPRGRGGRAPGQERQDDRRDGLLDPLDRGRRNARGAAAAAPARRERRRARARDARRDRAARDPLAQPGRDRHRERVVQEASSGRRSRGPRPPRLYHPYVGHDNNRDWYMFTQQETLLTLRHVYHRWHPQIVHDVHQMGPRGARLFVPPFTDPWEPNVDPALRGGGGRARHARGVATHDRGLRRCRDRGALRRLDAGACLSPHPRRSAHPLRDRLGADRDPARGEAAGARGPRPRVRPARRFGQLPRSLAGRQLAARRHRRDAAPGLARRPGARGPEPRALAADGARREPPRGRAARALCLRDPGRTARPLGRGAPGRRAARGRGGARSGSRTVRGGRAPLPGRDARRPDAAAGERLRQGAPREAALPGSARVRRRPAEDALRRDRAHAAAAAGRRCGRAWQRRSRPSSCRPASGLSSRAGSRAADRASRSLTRAARWRRSAGCWRRASRCAGRSSHSRTAGRSLPRRHAARPRLGAPHARAARRGARVHGARRAREAAQPRPAGAARGALPLVGPVDGRGLDALRVREGDGRRLPVDRRPRRARGPPRRALRRDRAAGPVGDDAAGRPRQGLDAGGVHGRARGGGCLGAARLRRGGRHPGGARHRERLCDRDAGAQGQGRPRRCRREDLLRSRLDPAGDDRHHAAARPRAPGGATAVVRGLAGVRGREGHGPRPLRRRRPAAVGVAARRRAAAGPGGARLEYRSGKAGLCCSASVPSTARRAAPPTWRSSTPSTSPRRVPESRQLLLLRSDGG